MTERVGFIGLGLMGAPMALNLRRAGYPVSVYARRPESAQPLVEAGARAFPTPKEMATECDIVFTIVSDTSDVEEVLFGDAGVSHGIAPGAVVVDMSTISASATRSMAERFRAQGVSMLDAPVSGGDVGARDGTLSIMVGGEDAVFARVLPLFEVMGRNIVHIGASGAGQVCKSCNQIVVGGAIAAVSEALLLARSSGVDPSRVRAALMGGFAQSRVLDLHGQRMIDGDFVPGFKTRLHQKDMRLVIEAANELGLALPVAALVAQDLNALMGQGEGESDSSAIYKLLERMSRADPS